MGAIDRGRSSPALMRWLLVGVVLGMHLFSPMVLADGSDNTNGEIANVIAPSSVVVHPNETVQTYITVHNKAAENQVFSVDALTVPEPISIIDLPKSELLVPNHLRQFTFGMMADGEAGFQNLSVTFSVTSDIDPEVDIDQLFWAHVDVCISPVGVWHVPSPIPRRTRVQGKRHVVCHACVVGDVNRYGGSYCLVNREA